MKLNVLFIAGDEFPPMPGGTGTVVYYAAVNLRADSIAVLSNVRNALPSSKYSHRYSPIFGERNKILQSFSAVRLAAWAKFSFSPTIIVAGSLWCSNVGLYLKKVLRVPMLLYAHGTEILRLGTYRWDKPLLALQAADVILPNSSYTGKLLLERGIDPARIEVINHAADPAIFYPLPSEEIDRIRQHHGLESKRILLTVANLQMHKGHDVVIRALPAIRERIPDVVYCIVGRGREEGSLRALARNLGVAGQVRFFTDINNRGRLREFYNLCDVFIMASRMIPERSDVEGFGIAFIEANACGKAVIGGRSGGVPDAVVDGVTGMLVTPEDVDDIARTVVRLLGDSQLARRLGEQGRERVIKELNWENRAERLHEVCERVIMRKRDGV